MRYLNSKALGALTAIGLIASGAAAAQHKPAGAPSVAPVGDATPSANLPAGVGPSGTSGTPAGPVRFDRVGYAAIAGDSAHGAIAAWGAGLPQGFAEVTDLATGRTVLVKTADTAARAGYLVELSSAVAQLLGIGDGAPAKVRVRQVEPIAADQVALDQGRPAAPRLDAPPILLTGLRAQLADVPAPAVAAAPKPTPAVAKTVGGPVPTPTPHLKPPVTAPPAKPAPVKAAPAPKPAPAQKTPPPAATGKYRVQVAAFASQANAKALAAKIGGHVIASGKYWRVELGPFADAAAAKRARDGVAKRGYGDARVITD
jgi:rare lipoprotein A